MQKVNESSKPFSKIFVNGFLRHKWKGNDRNMLKAKKEIEAWQRRYKKAEFLTRSREAKKKTTCLTMQNSPNIPNSVIQRFSGNGLKVEP